VNPKPQEEIGDEALVHHGSRQVSVDEVPDARIESPTDVLVRITSTNMEGVAGAAYGFADMGPWPGGQAELLRVPLADFDCLRLPEDAEEKQTDYVMLSDISRRGLDQARPAPRSVISGVLLADPRPAGRTSTPCSKGGSPWPNR
jgi:threonine dehydrogenase-like Zn-dependent dehydrogenase